MVSLLSRKNKESGFKISLYINVNYIYIYIFSILFLSLSSFSSLYSLPIGFGRTQGSIEYNELKSKNFYIYHDKDTPNEAEYVLKSLEYSRATVEKWFNIKRTTPLIVNMSAVTQEASFANFLTDSIELQTLGKADSSLAWHEYVHSITYLRLKNWLGSAGTIIHLAWLPSWWLEGLAEALSTSIGSDIQKGVERYYAQSKSWPSYEKLHRLYDGSSFAGVGYAISGSFVSYILATYKIDISSFMTDFYHESMPWWWPYAIIPFVDSLPLDTVLKKYTGKNGKQLYEEYKSFAERYWNRYKDNYYFLTDSKDRYKPIYSSYLASLQVKGEDIYKISSKRFSLYETKVSLDPEGKERLKYLKPSLDNISSYARVNDKDLKVFLTIKENKEGFDKQLLNIRYKDKDYSLERKAHVYSLYRSSSYIVWLESFKEESSVCYLNYKNEIIDKNIKCILSSKEPEELSIIGGRRDSKGVVAKVWLKKITKSIGGDDQYKIYGFYPDSKKLISYNYSYNEPVSITEKNVGKDKNNSKVYVLIRGTNSRPIVEMDSGFRCLKVYDFKDTFLDISHVKEDVFLVKNLQGSNTSYSLIDFSKLSSNYIKDCSILDRQFKNISPILVSINSNTPLDLTEALLKDRAIVYENIEDKSLDKNKDKDKNEGIDNDSDTGSKVFSYKDTDSLKNYDKSLQLQTSMDKESLPYDWRARLVFIFPWIGVNDYEDYYQVGILSVPLMDHLQNETVYLTTLFGIRNLNPDLSLTINSSRFWPNLNLSIFRTQSWDGWDKNGKSSYMKEWGANFTSSFFIRSWNTIFNLGLSVSHLSRFKYADDHNEGLVVQPYIATNIFTNLVFIPISLSSAFYISSDDIGSDFSYNKWKNRISITVPTYVLSSRFNLLLEHSRTRGSIVRGVQEYYRPIKKHTPGSGESLNDISIAFGSEGSLFTSSIGNNMVAVRPSITFTVLDDIAELVKIFYIDKLNFTAFFSYGGAWMGTTSDIKNAKMRKAHGYNLDLFFDVKGIGFNLGLGAGQVLKDRFEFYANFGFDTFL